MRRAREQQSNSALSTTKGGRSRPFENLRLEQSGRGRRLFGPPLRHRPGILAARIDIAVNQLDDANRRRVAVAVAGLEHAGVAAVARGVTRPEHIEQLLHHRGVAQLRGRLTARVQVAALGQRDQLLDDRAQVLRLRQRRDDLLVLDQRGSEMLEQRVALVGAPVELAVSIAVTHVRTPFREWRNGEWRMERELAAPYSLFATHYS